MGQEFVNVRLTRDANVTIGLFDIDPIKGREDSFVSEIDTVFRTDGGDKVTDRINICTPIARSSTWRHMSMR